MTREPTEKSKSKDAMFFRFLIVATALALLAFGSYHLRIVGAGILLLVVLLVWLHWKGPHARFERLADGLAWIAVPGIMVFHFLLGINQGSALGGKVEADGGCYLGFGYRYGSTVYRGIGPDSYHRLAYFESVVVIALAALMFAICLDDKLFMKEDARPEEEAGPGASP